MTLTELLALQGAPDAPKATPSALKATILREAQALAKTRCSVLGLAPRGACLVVAGAVLEVAKHHGVRLVLQAGTALWPRVRPDQDDGVSPTHFGYEWDPPNVARHLAEGRMPELHVWAGDPVTQELVDATTGQFVAQCKALIGEDWPGVKPPATWWAPMRELPDGVVYRANRDATFLAGRLLADMPQVPR